MLDVTREKAGIFSFGFFESGGGVPAFCLSAWANTGQGFLKHIYICALACKNIGFECRKHVWPAVNVAGAPHLNFYINV